MPLPAPYAPPWKRLGEDLVATAAWLGLKARELWRRNGEGTLPLPGFWPRRWPRLFWPLVVVLALGAALALGRVGLGGGAGAGSGRDRGEVGAEVPLGRRKASSGVGAAGPGMVRSGASGSEPLTPEASIPGALTPETSLPEVSIPGAAGSQASGSDASRPGASGRGAAGSESSGSEASGSEAPEPDSFPPDRFEPPATTPEGAAPADAPRSFAPLAPATKEATDGEAAGETATELDRLRAVLQADAPDGPILALIPDPAAATLTLELAEAFLALPPAQRQLRAEQWQEVAASEGYGHLRLRDGSGRALGREALVGGGMVLLDPPRPLRAIP